MSDRPNISTIKFSIEASEFIEAIANRDENVYWFPFYFKKVGDCLFEVIEFYEANGELKHIVERKEKPNPEEEEEE